MIEKNVPIPEPDFKKGSSMYGFSQMEPGDSIFYQEDDSVQKVRTCFRVFCHRNKWKGCSRKVEGGIRIWRVA